MERKDVGMAEPGGDLDLAQEALGAERGRQLGVEDLERDLAVVPEVLGEVDRGHPAAAELALERIAGRPARPSVWLDDRDGRGRARRLQEAVRLLVGGEQGFDLAPECRPSRTPGRGRSRSPGPRSARRQNSSLTRASART